MTANPSAQECLELVDEHARSWLLVGQSNSSYCYDPSAPYDKKDALETTQKLKQAIERKAAALARVEAFTRSQYERIPAVPHARPGSYYRGYDNGMSDILRGLSNALDDA